MARQHVESLRIKHRHDDREGEGSGRHRAASPSVSEDGRTFEEGGTLHEELVEELVQVIQDFRYA